MPAVRSRGRGADGDVPKAKPRSDAYVGLLALSLLVLGTAMLFAALNAFSYPETNPPKVADRPKAVPPGPGPGVPVVPPPGAQVGGQPPGAMIGGQPPGAQVGGQPPGAMIGGQPPGAMMGGRPPAGVGGQPKR